MDSIWKDIKTALKTHIPTHSYKMWVEPMEMVHFNGSSLTLACPNVFFKKRVGDQYGQLIEARIQEMTGKAYKLNLEVRRTGAQELPKPPPHRQLALPNMAVRPHSGRFLRRDFTFDHFVVGGNSKFAFSASKNLAAKNTAGNNALFLMANTGMGKSHLSQAVGHHILQHQSQEKVFYITAEDFTNEMVQSFKTDAVDQFKDRYRKQCDVLLLEDVQFLSGKQRTQDELAFALDALFDSGKKIIFTSCCPPSEIPKLNEKLRSRLACGLVSNIDPPDFKTRVNILKKKAQLNGHHVPEEVIRFLASELPENVRQLESGLIGVTAKSSLMNTPIDLRLAESVVRNIVRHQKSITIDVIKKMVGKYYQIPIGEMISNSRKQSVLRPRQVAIYLSRRFTDQPLQAIGKSFNRYHATVLHAIRSVEGELKHNHQLKQQLEILSRNLEDGRF